MPYLVKGIPATILADSGIREAQTAQGGPSAVVRYKTAWATRYDFVRALVGGSSGTGAITYDVPHAYEESPNLFALDVLGIEGFPKLKSESSGWPTYDYAIIEVGYRPIPYGTFEGVSGDTGPAAQPLTTINRDISAQILTLPDTAYSFVGGEPIDTPVGIVLPEGEISIKRHWVPYLPLPVSEVLVGKLNSATFTIKGYAYPIGTLMYVGMSTQEDFDTLGTMRYSLEYKLLYRRIHWNFYYRQSTGAYELVTDDGTSGGNPPYELANLAVLP